MNFSIRSVAQRLDRKWLNLLFLFIPVIALDDFLCTSRFFDYIHFHYNRSSLTVVIFYLVIHFTALSLSLLLLKIENRWLAGVFLGLFIVSGIVESLYHDINPDGFNKAEISIVLQGAELWRDALSSYLSTSMMLIASALIVFWFAIFFLARKAAWFGRNFAPKHAAFVVAGLLVLNVGVYGKLRRFRHYPSHVKTFSELTAFFIVREPVLKRVDVDVSVDPAKRLADHIVWVVDESIRGDMLSINGYEVATTPFLKSIKDRLLNFGVASSGSTISYMANSLMANGVQPETLPDAGNINESHQSILYFAKKAGYATSLLDMQATRLKDAFRPADAEFIDAVHFMGDVEPPHRRDVMGLEKLIEFMSGHERTFTYMIKAGAHFEYETRYPPDRKVFNPTLAVGEHFSKDRGRLLNSYGNNVRFAVDDWWGEFSERSKDYESLFVIYTSDHAQSLLEDPTYGRTHGGDRMEQSWVPLFVYGSQAVVQRVRDTHGSDIESKQRDRLSHFNIFPTLIHAFGIAEQPYGGRTVFDSVPAEDERQFFAPGSGRMSDLIPMKFEGP